MSASVFVLVIAVVFGSPQTIVQISPFPVDGDRAACNTEAYGSVINKADYDEAVNMVRQQHHNDQLTIKFYCVPEPDYRSAAAKAQNPHDLLPANDILIDANEVPKGDKF